MTSSPLLPYINCSGIYTSDLGATISITDGRLQASSSESYYLELFLRRSQSSGTDSGARQVPVSGTSDLMAGYRGSAFIYRGYLIRYGIAPDGFILGTSSSNGISMTSVGESRPEWLTTSGNLRILFGDSGNPMNCTLVSTSGVYGSIGIDQIIMSEVRGIPIVISAAEYSGQ